MEEYILLKDIAKQLNPISWDLLQILNKTEMISYSELKKKLNLSQSKVSKELARLEGALLVNSERDNVDQRVIYFKLTAAGCKILNYK